MSIPIRIDLKQYLTADVKISIIFTHPEAFMRRIEPKAYHLRDVPNQQRLFELFLKPETRKFELEFAFVREQFIFMPKSYHLELFMSHLTQHRIMVAGPDGCTFAEFRGRHQGRFLFKGPLDSIVEPHQVV